eukprot:TRINITY_DN8746_c0_g1_i1.p1 TRINITY_DN8746_c0_g1~~TRINITY_DN8746_c0_g1_i1.p1  ORF type:complete len:222 (+),score=69.43 TRINITY_DN8746_c0_g1_i1:75-668(+)
MADAENADDSEYKVSAKVGVNDLMSQDAEDESLRKYKEALLGKLDGDVAPTDDPRRVVIKEMKVICENRPGGDITYTLDTEEAVLKMKKQPFTLKEGCNYKIQVTFKVQHEIVSGLKYINQVFKGMLKVDTQDEMLGSFGPNKENHVVTFPRLGWEEAPKGMLSRGSFTAKSKFIDDDGERHLEYGYSFAIKKDWGK